MRLGSGAFEGSYDFRSRMGDGTGTNPEELLGAVHAGCFSMDGGWSIHRIDLEMEALVSDVATAAFEEQAQSAKKNCPVSRALSGVDVYLRAKLL